MFRTSDPLDKVLESRCNEEVVQEECTITILASQPFSFYLLRCINLVIFGLLYELSRFCSGIRLLLTLCVAYVSLFLFC